VVTTHQHSLPEAAIGERNSAVFGLVVGLVGVLVVGRIHPHLTIVFAALAVSRLIEDRTGWSIKNFVRTARRYRTIGIRTGQHTVTAQDALPTDLHDALAQII